MTLTKAKLAEHLHHDLGLNKREAMHVVKCFFEQIATCLDEGQKVKIAGFGTFSLRSKRERPGRNPKTDAVVVVSARRVVRFSPVQQLRQRVETYAQSKQ